MPIEDFYGKKKTYPLGIYPSYGNISESGNNSLGTSPATPPATSPSENATPDQVATTLGNMGQGFMGFGPIGAVAGLVQSLPQFAIPPNQFMEPTLFNLAKESFKAMINNVPNVSQQVQNTIAQHQMDQTIAQQAMDGVATGFGMGQGLGGFEAFADPGMFGGIGDGVGADGSAAGDAAAAASMGGEGTAGEGEGW